MSKIKSNSVSSASQQTSTDFDPDAAFRPMLQDLHLTRIDENCGKAEGFKGDWF